MIISKHPVADLGKSLTIALTVMTALSLPTTAQQDRISLRDALNRQPDDIKLPESQTPEEEAAVHYQQAVALVQKAIQQNQKASENEGAKREKMLNRARKAFEGAAREFRLATEKHPGMLESWSGLGWVYRQTARWDESVNAYDQALELEPKFTAALEGRAEALLELDRIDEVRQTYSVLERVDAKNAQQLLSAVENWVHKRHRAGQGDDRNVREMMAFVVEKRQAS